MTNSSLPNRRARRNEAKTRPSQRRLTAPPQKSRRAAYAHPRVLGGLMVLMLVGFALWSIAATTTKPATTAKKSPQAVGATAPASKGAAGKPLSLKDLPRLVQEYGQRRAQAAGHGRIGTKLYPLTEMDLTQNTPSDEREPAYSPAGNFIAFSSNAIPDANGNLPTGAETVAGTKVGAHYHIWYMNSDGTGQHQVTGLTKAGPNEDDNRDQFYPAWNAAGNKIVYVDRGMYPNDAANLGTGPKSELYILQPFLSGSPTARATFSGGDKRRPSWSPDGGAIAFATNVDPRIDNTITPAVYQPLPSFDIFTIDPGGSESSVVRITGTTTTLAVGTRTDNTNDTLGDQTDDLSPSYSQVNSSVIFFSSNRDVLPGPNPALLAAGRRIWASDSIGQNKRQITNPRIRGGGTAAQRAAAIDDYPSPSGVVANSYNERVAFQSNSLLDNSDTFQDLNIWSVPVQSNLLFIPGQMEVGGFADQDQRIHSFSYPSGRTIGLFSNTSASKPEDVLFGPDINGDGFSDLYVSERGASRIGVYDGATGQRIRTFAGTGASSPATDLAAPTGMVFDNQFLYVGDGNAAAVPAAGSIVARRVHRFFIGSGAPAPSQGETGSVFTHAPPTGITDLSNGIEGIAFGPDGLLYVTSLSDNRIVRYDTNGTYVPNPPGPVPPGTDFVTTGSNGLSLPTGIAFFNNNLYVCSAGTDQVKEYAGPFSGTPGAWVRDLITDPNGATTQLNDPERLRFFRGANDPQTFLFVSSFSQPFTDAVAAPNLGNGRGDHVNRYDPNTGASLPSIDPITNTQRPGAIFAQDNGSITGTPLVGAASFDFNPVARNGTPPIETNVNGSSVETNRISSVNGFNNSQLQSPENCNGLTGGGCPATPQTVGEDKSADREPSFNRITTTGPVAAKLTFASQRRTAAIPAPDSSNPNPVVVNPFGGQQQAGDTGATQNPNDGTQTPPTHDIWGTNTQDYTPPILIPQAIGNVTYPFIAPGPQAPVHADPSLTANEQTEENATARTYEQGLRPWDGTSPVPGPHTLGPLGMNVTIALVMQEKESGLSSVRVTFKDADQPNYYYFAPATVVVNGTGVDENINVPCAAETQPSAVPGKSGLALTVYDDGPPSRGGHELEANAVAGDGIYYCSGTFTTPTTTGDFYIDVSASDRAGNGFTYDNVWGFTTRHFLKSAATSNLFVSDYTVGQVFPSQLGPDARFQLNSPLPLAGMPPVESYFLTNPGDTAQAEAGYLARTGTDIPVAGSPSTPRW